MRFLYAIRLAVPLHSWRDVVAELCMRGHRVRILFDPRFADFPEAKRAALADFERTHGGNFDRQWAGRRSDWRRHYLFPLRQLAGWRRYFFAGQPEFFRDRWLNLFPRWLRLLARLPGARALVKSAWFGRLVQRLERSAPVGDAIRRQIEEFKPDAIVFTVANMRYGSVDADYCAAAQVSGVPTAVMVFSWDSLTTKGVIPFVPDALLVWNRHMISDAIEHHRVPRERIRIVGAPGFDKWLMPLTPAPRDEFCRRYGLRSRDPIVLWLGASRNIALDETWVIRDLRGALDRAADPRLRKTQIIVRPHPANAAIYESFALPDMIVLPRGGASPDPGAGLRLLYDSIFHSTAAAGVYTSAMMDVVIAGRPVIALKVGRYRQTQEDAQYFRVLAESRAIGIAESPEDFCGHFSALLDGTDPEAEARRRFPEEYIWPAGNRRPAAEVAADELEQVAQTKHFSA